LPLMLVGLRVLGETNWGPISAMSNMMQAVFGVLAPGHILANMVASGTTGTIAADSEALMQDYKAGHMIGSAPKHLASMHCHARSRFSDLRDVPRRCGRPVLVAA